MRLLNVQLKTLITLLALATFVAGCAGDRPENLVASAKEYLAKNDTNAAIIQLKNALQKDPNLAEARFLLGRSLLQTGDALSAEKELRKALEFGYRPAEVNPSLARALVQTGQTQKVVDELGQADAA